MNEDLRDRDKNLNILDWVKTKLEMNKCPKFINSIKFILTKKCLLMFGDSWKMALKGMHFALLLH